MKMIDARLGTRLAFEALIKLGVRVLKAERKFNGKFRIQQRRTTSCPKFFYEEPLPPHNTVFVVSDEEMDSVFDF